MSKRHSAKYKIDRRMGENIWGRPKSPVNKRSYPPGQHGQNRRGKLSDFGTQLRVVNGKKVNIPSYRCKEGDVIEVREKSRTMALVLEALESSEREVPDYISVDPKGMQATFTRTPSFDEVPYPVVMEPNLTVEFYSR